MACKVQWPSCGELSNLPGGLLVFHNKFSQKHRPSCRRRAQPDGEFLPAFRPRKKEQLRPCLELSSEEAVNVQLQALKANNTPHVDFGVEVLYRFSNIDPFDVRSRFFGRARDLGQFEKFRRQFHTHEYRCLLSHTEHQALSSLQVSDLQWRYRVWVKGFRQGEEGVFEFVMTQRLGGRYDGVWFTDALLFDSPDTS